MGGKPGGDEALGFGDGDGVAVEEDGGVGGGVEGRHRGGGGKLGGRGGGLGDVGTGGGTVLAFRVLPRRYPDWVSGERRLNFVSRWGWIAALL